MPKLGSFRKIALTCCILVPLPLSAWWETGHQAIARIAASRLTPAARTRIARILDVPDTPESVADALARASTWADETRSQTKTGEWHYIDLTRQDDKSDIPERCPHDNCAPARIRLFAAQLESRTETGWSELDALRFLVHFVGDIHQPLHDISDADLGGNCEQLAFPIEKAKNLHALWDGGIVASINPNDRALADELEQEIDGWSHRRQRALARGSVDDWTWQGHEIALKDVYERLHIPTEPVEFPPNCKEAPSAVADLKLDISPEYVNEMKPVVRDQLIKAGLRLAKLLNEAL
jgi:hypothetical protein